MDTIVSTWFVADTPEEQSNFPQVGNTSSSRSFQDVYWKCIAVFFATSTRANPGCQHVLFSNTDPPEVDGTDLARFLEDLGVRTVRLPIRHRLPKGQIDKFGNQFYILDILDYVAASDWNCRLFVLDSDCVWIRSIEPMERAIDAHGVLTYPLNYSEDAPINGVSRSELRLIAEKLTGVSISEVPTYFGGEIVATGPRECRKIADKAEEVWQRNLDLVNRDQPALKEEAHLLSVVYRVLGVEGASAAAFIKRIWTTFKFSNVERSDLALTIWHLPAEKRSGFEELYPQVVDDRSMFWTLELGGPYTEYLSRCFGIPRRSWRKLRRDLRHKLTERLSVRR